jgi:hypothetical protein
MGNISHTSGNVGIGTASPLVPLHVDGGNILVARAGNFEQDINFNGFGSAGGYARGLLFTSGGITAGFGVLGTYTTTSHTVDNIFLAHGGSPWSSGTGLYVLRSGNVGVGTTSPTVKLDVSGDIKATNIALTGKATSAATDAADAATTLSTKGYVESTARVGTTICFSKTGVVSNATITVGGTTVTVGSVVQGSGSAGVVPFSFPSNTKWSGFAFVRTNGSAARAPTHFDNVASFNMTGDASNEPTTNTFIIIATRIS